MEYGEDKIPIVKSNWNKNDYIGALKMRVGIGRFQYKIPTGLYGIGKPKNGDPIFVTANYKYTFDILRRDLDGIDGFILVLNTDGINVWCAAGKGTFSSKEIIYQIEKNNIRKNLIKSKIILPQLGAPSVEPHLIQKMIGVKVIYGPIRSEDIKDFLNRDMVATGEMRNVTFKLSERLILTPLEFILNFKWIVVAFILNGIILGFLGEFTIESLLKMTAPFFIANIIGSVIFPAILPIMPFKSFSLNGGMLGIIFGIVIHSRKNVFSIPGSEIFFLGYMISIIVLVVYIAFNFTGCTTFTSVSGVKKEAKYFKMFIKYSLLLSFMLLAFEIVRNTL